MNKKIEDAHQYISGLDVAQIIIEFQREFHGVYSIETLASSLGAVGPVQSLIGLAIKNGHLSVGDKKQ